MTYKGLLKYTLSHRQLSTFSWLMEVPYCFEVSCLLKILEVFHHIRWSSSGSSGWVREVPRNMKSMQPPLVAFFHDLIFTGPGDGPFAHLDPLLVKIFVKHAQWDWISSLPDIFVFSDGSIAYCGGNQDSELAIVGLKKPLLDITCNYRQIWFPNNRITFAIPISYWVVCEQNSIVY